MFPLVPIRQFLRRFLQKLLKHDIFSDTRVPRDF